MRKPWSIEDEQYLRHLWGKKIEINNLLIILLLLDTYCKAGGASVGYNKAGFDVIGVDIEPQPNYPFEFYKSDAISFIENYSNHFDIIHASPPCQKYSIIGKAYSATHGKQYQDSIPPARTALERSGKPFIIENVPFAPIRPDLILFGYMFGLKVIRQRWFEMGGGIWMMNFPKNRQRGTVREGDYVTVAGKGAKRNRSGGTYWGPAKFYKGNIQDTWSYAMGIDWMTRAELAQAIPPVYTEYIGRVIKKQLHHREKIN